MTKGYYVEKLRDDGQGIRRAGPRKTIEDAQSDRSDWLTASGSCLPPDLAAAVSWAGCRPSP
jgi:hypothetical protein